MKLPNFLTKDDKSLVFNQDNKQFIFYVPEVFFNAKSKTAIAEVQGEYVSMLGICQWDIIDSNGKHSKLMPFIFPTMILCKPSEIEKVKNYKLGNNDPDDYRLLHFKKGDEVISETRVPQQLSNVELFMKAFAITGKIPSTIPYDKLWKLFEINAKLNGFNYKLNNQILGLVSSELARSKNDVSKPYRLSNSKNPLDYKFIGVKLLPNYVSPFSSVISENWDESLRSAILMKDVPDKDLPMSPIEKVLMK